MQAGIQDTNFLYSLAWLDLSGGPLVLSLPDTGGRFYEMQFTDVYNNVPYTIGEPPVLSPAPPRSRRRSGACHAAPFGRTVAACPRTSLPCAHLALSMRLSCMLQVCNEVFQHWAPSPGLSTPT